MRRERDDQPDLRLDGADCRRYSLRRSWQLAGQFGWRIMGILWTFGMPPGFGTKGNRRDRGGGTADGGRCSPIDYMVDSFGPNPNETPEGASARVARVKADERRLAVTQRFQVT